MRALVLPILFLLALVQGCDAWETKKEISRSLGIDVSCGEIMDVWDTHGGFHGDGFSVVTLQDPEGCIYAEILGSGQWRSFPLSGSVMTLLYGMAEEGPHEGRTSGDALPIPRVTNGCWYFRDRHYECTDPGNDSMLFARASINCTVAVYDMDTGTLYYMEYDT